MKNKKKKSARKLSVFSNYDFRILLLFGLVVIAGILFLAMQYSNYVDCQESEFYIISDHYAVGEVIQFSNETPNANEWKWDFGDGTPKSDDKQALHKYDKPGVYLVRLTINGSCEREQIVEIKYSGEIMDQTKVPTIIANQFAEVGKPVDFTFDFKGDAFSWEWSFGESGNLDNTRPYANYSYKRPGIKSVTLIVNGDVRHLATKTIYVRPERESLETDTTSIYTALYGSDHYERPPDLQDDPITEVFKHAPLVPTPKPVNDIKTAELAIAPNISEDQFELMLLQIASQSKTKEDFSQYICSNYQIPVVKDGDILIDFSEFCKLIKGKKIKIESLRLTRDNMNCVKGFDIEYKIKKMIGWGKQRV